MTVKKHEYVSYSGRKVTAITDDGVLPHLDVSVAPTAQAPETSFVLLDDAAVRLATDILRVFAPEKLAVEPQKRLLDRVGEYLAGVEGTPQAGKVVRIAGPVAQNERKAGLDQARVRTVGGAYISIYNEIDGEQFWRPVDVEVIPPTAEEWKVVEQ